MTLALDTPWSPQAPSYLADGRVRNVTVDRGLHTGSPSTAGRDQRRVVTVLRSALLAIIGGTFTVGLALILAGCGYQRPTVALGPNLGLYFHQDAATVTLAYGPPNSDAAGLVLQCAKGSRQVDVSDMARKASAGPLSLSSGHSRSDLKTRIETEETGQPTLWSRTTVDDPALVGFRRTGKIGVAFADWRYGLNASPAERTSVERFFTACERA